MSTAAGGPRRILITGANGFIGRHLCDRFRHDGWVVRGLVRDVERARAERADVDWFRGDLPDEIDESAFAGTDALIHGAYMSRFTNLAEARRVNEEGTARVYNLARRAGVGKFAFISTTSAHDEARSYYGRSKLAIEQRLDPERDLIFRAGMVLGPDGGLFLRLTGALKRTGILPLFDGGRQPVQTVHIDDLCTAIATAIDRDLSGRFVVAEPDGLPMRELFLGVADRMGKRCVAVPVPTGPLLVGLRLCERLRIPLPISSENLLGARALRLQPSAADLERLGVTLRSARESLDDLFPPA